MALDDLGIDEDELLVLLLRVGRQVEDEEAIGQAHLVGGQAHPLGGIHQPEHLRDGRPQVIVDLGHGPRVIAKGGVGIIDDMQHESGSRATGDRSALFYSQSSRAARFPAGGMTARPPAVMRCRGPSPLSSSSSLPLPKLASIVASAIEPIERNPHDLRRLAWFSFGFVLRFTLIFSGDLTQAYDSGSGRRPSSIAPDWVCSQPFSIRAELGPFALSCSCWSDAILFALITCVKSIRLRSEFSTKVRVPAASPRCCRSCPPVDVQRPWLGFPSPSLITDIRIANDGFPDPPFYYARSKG